MSQLVYLVLFSYAFFFKGLTGLTITIGAVATLFSNPWALLAGWIHYLAFDLLIGTWETRDAREHGVPHVLLVPCLLLTFLFGPAGWLLYRGVRLAKSSQMRQSLSSVS